MMTGARAQLTPGDDLEIVIGPMKRRHIRAVHRIEQQVYPRPWSTNLFMSEIGAGPTRTYVVARAGATLVGYGGLMMVPDDGHITTIAVDPRWHRHKIGTRVLVTLVRSALTKGATALTLEVRISNEPAQRLYQRFGFVPAGVRKGYYQETNEDALIMWATDVDQPDFSERLESLEAELPNPTVLEGLDR